MIALLIYPRAFGIQIKVDGRLPRLPEYLWRPWGLKGDIFGVYTLQRKLLLGCLILCCGLFVSHGNSPKKLELGG
jgi:hypothetical protein